MQDVDGKTAFITGGASGVGFGMAKVFSDAGMKVVIADIRQDHLDTATEFFRTTNRAVHPIQLDVTDRAAFARAADEAESVFGNVHVVCNNAGINLFAPVDESTYDDWDWVLGVNLGGVVNGVQTFAHRLKAHGEGGHIVNTASMASFLAGPSAGIYTASKFAVRGLSETLRCSLAKFGIGVSVLCPGLVNSAIWQSDKIRPQALSGEVAQVDQGFMNMLPGLHQLGMPPEEVGEKVLAGIRANQLYIFSHPEFKDELRELFDEIVEAVPDASFTEADAGRLGIEQARRKSYRAARHGEPPPPR